MTAVGQQCSFATPRNQVGYRAVTRRSGSAVGNKSVCRPGNAPGRTHALCQIQTSLLHGLSDKTGDAADQFGEVEFVNEAGDQQQS